MKHKAATAAVIALAWGTLATSPVHGQYPERPRVDSPNVGAVHNLMVNGRPARPDVEPRMIAGRMMVPIRFVAQELGAMVTWNPQTRVVRLLQGTDDITLIVGSTVARVNGLPRVLAVPPVVHEGRTLVPLRAVALFTGGRAMYDPRTRTVFVNTRGGPGNPEAGVLGGGL